MQGQASSRVRSGREVSAENRLDAVVGEEASAAMRSGLLPVQAGGGVYQQAPTVALPGCHLQRCSLSALSFTSDRHVRSKSCGSARAAARISMRITRRAAGGNLRVVGNHQHGSRWRVNALLQRMHHVTLAIGGCIQVAGGLIGGAESAAEARGGGRRQWHLY